MVAFLQYMFVFILFTLQQKLGKCTVMTPTQNAFGSQSKIAVVPRDLGSAGAGGRRGGFYMANRMRNATIRQNRPMASDRAKPKIA